LRKRLFELKGEFPKLILEVRGLGLMVGALLSKPCREIVVSALERGLIINCTAGNVLRFVPPLVITEEEIDYGMEILREVLKEDES